MKLSTTIELSKEQISQIVEDYLETQDFVCVGKVVFSVERVTRGYGMGEHDLMEFCGISVKVEPKE